MNRRQLGFGLLTIFIVSLFFGNNSNTRVLTENKIEGIGETEVTPASDWVQGLGATTPTTEDQDVYLKNVANWLVITAKPANGGLTWSSGLENRSGYYDGVAGIVSFLAKMYQTTRNNSYLETARKALYWLDTSSGIKVGTGKYKESDYFPRNYTGLESGAAGIGKSFIDMYQATGNQSYLLSAEQVAWWLLDEADVVGEGMRWPYKESITVTSVLKNPSSNKTNYGFTPNLLSTLYDYDGNTYDIIANNTGSSWLADCEFYFNTTDWGLYKFFNDFEESDKFLNYNMQVTVRATTDFNSAYYNSNVSLGLTGASWSTVNPSTINTTVQSVNYATTQNIYNYVWNRVSGAQFRVRVQASNSSAFTIQLNELNITLTYDDTAYYPDWSLGAAGIGQFFLDLYKVTSNFTYYYTAANASRYLRDVAKAGATGLYWEKLNEGFTSIKDGVAGIGKFLVDLYKANASDLLPLNLAVEGANWTIQQRSATSEGFTEDGDSLGATRRYEYSNKTSSDYRSGYYDGAAGIGDFLLDLASVTSGPNGTLFLSAANATAAYLSAYNLTSFGTTLTLLNFTRPYTYRWLDFVGSSTFSNGSQTGAAGNLVFLSRYARLTGSKVIGSIVDGGLRYLTASLQNNFTGLGNYYYIGCAGLGDCLLQVSNFAGTAAKVGVGGLNYLLTQENNGRWDTSSTPSNEFSGMYQGSAGIGLAMLEGFKTTGDARYLEAARRAALSLSVPSGQYEYVGTTTTFFGKAYGLAGIADFLLEMFVSTGNTTYRDWATSTLDRLLAVNKGSLDSARWNQTMGSGSNDICYDYRDGTSGIASTFLKAFQATANSTYLRVARGTLVYLDSVDISGGYMNHWNPDSGNAAGYTGWDIGSAGIGSVYLQAFQMTGNQSYLATASGVALWLNGQHDSSSGSWYEDAAAQTSATIPFATGTAGVVNFLLQLYRTNASAIVNGEIDYGLHFLWGDQYTPTGIMTITSLGWSTGLAGTLGVLAQAVSFNRTLVSGPLQSGIAKLLSASYREASGAWHVSTASAVCYSGISDGSAGIFRIIATLPDLSNPALASAVAISGISYEQTITVNITTSDAFSNISSIFLGVTFNNVTSTRIAATHIVSDAYEALIPSQVYGTNVSFVIVSVDDSGQISFLDNNSNNYRYTVQDLVAPQYSLIRVVVGSEVRVAPAYGQNAKFTIDATEPSAGSQIQSVVLYYSFEGELPYQSMVLERYPPLSNTFQTPDPGVVVGGTRCFGDAFSFYFNITDNAGNIASTPVNNTYIHDYSPPMINPVYQMTLIRPEFPAMTPMAITLNISSPVTACEAPIPKDGGAFVLYTINSVDWIRVNLTRTTEYTDYALFDGSLPGMNVGDIVRFVLCAQDAGGNMRYMGLDKTLYTSFEDIPDNNYFYYTTSMNWLLFFVIVAIIAAVVSFSYIIYMRRGGYWQRMRRTASAKATAISVQAKFASMYYWMVEKLQNTGIKLRKAGRKVGEKLQDFGSWAGEKVGEKISRFFRAIGRVIADFFKGIGNAIAGIFGVLKNIIIKIRWYQVLLFVLFGLLLILFPVIKWIMDQQYPLRAVFYMGMGLVIFIAGFVVFIMNLIYQISYK